MARNYYKAIQEQLKYTVDNPCDYFMWNPKNGNFYALELKTTKETSLTYWQKEFEEAGKDKKFMIRKNQILSLMNHLNLITLMDSTSSLQQHSMSILRLVTNLNFHRQKISKELFI